MAKPAPRAAARDPILSRILAERGAATRIAERCGITRQAVVMWRSVPHRHLRAVSRATGIAVEKLLPKAKRK